MTPIQSDKILKEVQLGGGLQQWILRNMALSSLDEAKGFSPLPFLQVATVSPIDIYI